MPDPSKSIHDVIREFSEAVKQSFEVALEQHAMQFAQSLATQVQEEVSQKA